jgi:hypothetical protein
MATTSPDARPHWWNDDHESAWDKVKHLFQRSFGAHPSPHRQWTEAEPGLRFGYGARRRANEDAWDEEVEARLEQEWDTIHHQPEDSPGPVRTWHDVRQFVHRGWLGP